MEVPLCDIFMTGEHVIISKGPHSLWCSREDGSLKPGSGKRVSGAPYLSQTSTLAFLVAMAVHAYTPSYCFSSPLAVLGVSGLAVVTPDNLEPARFLGKCWGLVGKMQFFAG